MRQTEQEGPDVNALIAPGEITELVARLSEQSVSAIPPHEARTLEGLAAETGIPVERLRDTLAEIRNAKSWSVPPAVWLAFAFLVCLAYWLVNHPTPAQIATAPTKSTPVIAAPVETKPDLTGTVPLSNVTYGPDGGSLQVDPGFEPVHSLPDGMSICTTIGTVLWGSGDHHAKVLDKPLSTEQQDAIRANIVELLRYTRAQAAKRHLPIGSGQFAPGASSSGWPVELYMYMYYGVSATTVTLPPPGEEGDKTADRVIMKAANTLLEQIQNTLRQQRENRRMNGP